MHQPSRRSAIIARGAMLAGSKANAGKPYHARVIAHRERRMRDGFAPSLSRALSLTAAPALRVRFSFEQRTRVTLSRQPVTRRE